MADSPILFGPPMVRALLAGTKTQTRRVLRPQPYVNGFKYDANLGDILCHNDYLPPSALLMDRGKGPNRYTLSDAEDGAEGFARRYVGDRLYVREAWRVSKQFDAHSPVHSKIGGKVLPPRSMTVLFEAGGSIANQASGRWEPDSAYPPAMPEWAGKFRQGMHMPRWASRLTLIVIEVRVRRLQEINEADAIAEGIEKVRYDGADARYRGMIGWRAYDRLPDGSEHPFNAAPYALPTTSYRSLWDSLNSKRGFGWDANPWVTATSFTVHLGNIDARAAAAE